MHLRKLIIGLTVGLGLSALGCRKIVTVDGQDVGANKKLLGQQPGQAVATVIQLPGGIGSNRSYFQTRSVVVVKIPATTLQVGDTFSLLNKSAGKTLVDHQSTTAAALDGYDFQLRIYPGDDANTGKLLYGANDLTLEIDDKQPKSAAQTIYLRDFRWMTVQTSHFSDSLQRKGGLQGEVSGYIKPTVSNGNHLMTTGFLPTINR